MDKAKPIIVLAIIAAFISTLVIVVYNLTYVDTSNEVTDKQADALVAIYGGSKEDYAVIPVEEWKAALMFSSDNTIGENIEKVFKKKDGSLAIECVVKGYKKGFDIMVGVQDGTVAGVAIVSVGEETPGLGTKTNNPDWLGNFKGISGSAEIVKTAPSSDNQVQAVTSATYSSRGVATAVNSALKAYGLLSVFVGGEAQ
ncbi:MAG: FMN-binding protein [Oscillospiraceae bacterium]|nr:FMN-binding protein [Oscillospiraceae bacterium]